MSKSRRISTRVFKAKRRLFIEALESRRLLASDLPLAFVGPLLSYSQVHSQLIGEGTGPGGGAEVDYPPDESMTADQVFPELVFPPPFDEEIIDDWNLDGRKASVGGITDSPSGTPNTGNGSGLSSPITVNPPVTITLRNDMIAYEGDTPRFLVLASGPVTRAVTVSLAYESALINGATAGSDYIATASVTIPVNASSMSVSVPFLKDTLAEPTEFFKVRIVGVSVPPSVAKYEADARVNGTIYNVQSDNNSPRVRELSIRDATAMEGVDQTMYFVVTASNAANNARSVSVKYETIAFPAGNSSATSNVDYVYSTGTITFAPNQSEATIAIAILDDLIVENTEYFKVVLSNPSFNASLRQDTAVGTILDNDLPVRVNVDPAPVVKEGETSYFRVWVDSAVRTVSGSLRTSSGSATQNIDYVGGDYSFTIPAGFTYTFVGVPTIINNDPPELDVENYFGELVNVVNATIGNGSAQGLIGEKSLKLTVTHLPTTKEGDTPLDAGKFYFFFSIPSDFQSTVTLPYHTEDRTASQITDYVPASGTITFTKGVIDPLTGRDYNRVLIVDVRPDLIPEVPVDETLVLILGDPVNARLVPDEKTYTLTIKDDDDVPVLTMEPAQAEEGQPAQFKLKLNKLPASGAATVKLYTQDGSAFDGIGSDPAPPDYLPIGVNSFTGQSSPVTISLTQLTTIISIDTLNDGLVESDETFTLNALQPTSIRLSNTSVTGTILDNDTQIDLAIKDASEVEGDSGYDPANKLKFDVVATRTGKAITNDIQIGYNTSTVSPTLPDGSPNPRYATPVADFMPTSGFITIPGGQGSNYFPVDINGDLILESNEDLYGNITGYTVVANSVPNAGTVTVNIVRSKALGTIIDDDAVKTAKIGFDFVRELDEAQHCECTSADTPDGATVSAKEGDFRGKPYAIDNVLEMRLGGNDSTMQLDALVVTQNAGTDVPDKYTVTMEVGGYEFPPLSFPGKAGDAQRKIAFTAPLDLTSYSTGMYQGKISIVASKAAYGGTLIYRVEKPFVFKVVNNQNSEYTPQWWNPHIERLYPQKVYGNGNIGSPNFSQGALYVRGDQTAWWFKGSNFTTPDGIFATLRKLTNGEYELRDLHGELKIFNPSGTLNRIVDRNGNTTTFAYVDADGDGVSDELSLMTEPLNRTTTYTYSSGLLTSIRDFSNRETLYTVVNNKLTRITAPDPDDAGPRTSPFYDFVYLFDAAGGYIRMTDAETEQTTYRFNKFGRVTKIEMPDGTNWQYNYLKDKGVIIRLPDGTSSGAAILPGEREAIVTNPRGFKTKYWTDRFGLPTKIIYANSSMETFDRNKHGQPLTHSYPTPDGTTATATYTYDAKQNLSTLVSPEVGTATWTYDATYSLPLSQIVTGQPDQVFTRDANGNVLTVTTKARQTAIGTAANTERRGPASAVYTNPIDAYDADNDGLVSSLDSQAISDYVNLLYGTSGDPLPEETKDGRPLYPDVNADGSVGVLDILTVINFVNVQQQRVQSYAYTTGADGLPKGMLASYTNPSSETTTVEYFSTATSDRGRLKTVSRSGAGGGPIAKYTYNADGNVSSVEDFYGRKTLYFFDRLDQLTEVRDVAPDNVEANRPKTIYQYSVMGHLNQITDPAGQDTLIASNPFTRQVSVTLSGGGDISRTYSSSYDPMYNLISESDPLGRVTSYEYNSMDRLTKTTLPTVGSTISTVEYQYNPAGATTSVKDVLGTTTSYTYAASGDVVKVSRPNPTSGGAPIDYLYGYASPGVLASITDPLGAVTNYVTDNFGNLAAINYPVVPVAGVTNPGRAKETVAYDSSGRSLASTDVTGQFQLATIDILGRVTQTESMDPDRFGAAVRPKVTYSTPQLVNNTIVQTTTLPNGLTYKTTSDLRDRVVSYEMPKLNGQAGNIVGTAQYDVLDRTTSETSPTGAVTQYAYNRINKVTQVLGANHVTGVADSQYAWNATYDAAGRLTQVLAPNGGATNYNYDDWGRLTFRGNPDPDGSGPAFRTRTSWQYDLVNRKIVQSTSDGNVETDQFDTLGRVTSHKDGDGGITQFVYDNAGQLKQLTDPVGNVTRWTYDAAGQTTKEEQVGIGNRLFKYSVDGLLSEYQDRTGAITQYAYNLGSQPTSESWLDSSYNYLKGIFYNYDSQSRPTSVGSGANDRVAWTYNAAGLVSSETTTMPTVGSANFSANIVSSLNYSYDSFGRLAGKQLAVDGTTHYTDSINYDKRDRVTSIVRTGSGNANENMWSTLQYDALDQIVGTQRGSGSSVGTPDIVQTITRDIAGRPTQINYAGSATLATYSMVYFSGTDRLVGFTTPEGTTSYEYSPGGQLTRAGSTYYTYDANGNPTSRGGQTVIVGVFNKITDDGQFTYDYDAEGRTIQRTNKQSGVTERFDWDHRSQLKRINVLPNVAATTPTQSVQYGYDVIGRRSSINTTNGSSPAGSVVDYLLSDGGQVGEILGDSGTIKNRFLFGPEVDMVLAEQTFANGTANKPGWQLTDHLGTVRGVAQRPAAGGNVAVVNSIQYDAFGSITAQTDTTKQPRMGFAGRDTEKVGGLTYNRNRYYSTSSGRFISQDPMSFNAGDGNLYRYVGNEVTTATDPSGLHGPVEKTTKINPIITVLHPPLLRLTDGEKARVGIKDPNPFPEGPRAEGWHAMSEQEGSDLRAVFRFEDEMKDAGTSLLLQEQAIRNLQIHFGTYSPIGDIARPGGGFDKAVGFLGAAVVAIGPYQRAAGAKPFPSGKTNIRTEPFPVSPKTVKYPGPSRSIAPSQVFQNLKPLGRKVVGDWQDDGTGRVGRTAVYDSDSGELVIGGLQNHSAVLRAASHSEKSAKGLSGLVLRKLDGKIYFEDYSGFFPRKLTDAEKTSISLALEAEFCLPAVHGKAPISRPGAPPTQE